MTDPTSRQRGRPKKGKTVTLKKKRISGQKSHIWARHQDILTDCQSQCDFDFDFDIAQAVSRRPGMSCGICDGQIGTGAGLLRVLQFPLQIIPPTAPMAGVSSRLSLTPTPKKKNSMVWVRERIIPTERPPLVGEVIANFCGWRVPRGQRDGSLRPYSRFSRQEPLLFYQVAPQLYSRG
jgi:hypothetical protein